MIGVYKITNPKGRVYVGQSQDIEKRFSDYKKYKNCKRQTRLYNSFLRYEAKNHVFEIIELCELENLNIVERLWQDYYNVLGKKGLNCLLTDSKDKPRIVSQTTRKKMSEANKGKSLTTDCKKKIGVSQHVKVCQFDKDGKYINTFNSMLEAESMTGTSRVSISNCCRKKIKTANNSFWCYEDNKKSFVIPETKKIRTYKKIINTETGETFDSTVEVAKSLNIQYYKFYCMLNGRIKNKTKMKYIL